MRNITLVLLATAVSLISFSFNVLPDRIEYDLCDNVTGESKTLVFSSKLEKQTSILTVEEDDCASASLLAEGASDSGTNTGSGEEAGELVPAGLTSPISSVWYEIMPTDGTVEIDFTNTSMTDPVISIYSAGCPVATAAIFQIQVLPATVFPLSVCLTGGTNYLVQIATSGGNEGDFDFEYSSMAGPTNDECVGASNEPVSSGSNVSYTCSDDGIVWMEYTVLTGDHVAASTSTPGYSITSMLLDDCSTIVTSTTCLAPGDIIHIAGGAGTAGSGMFTVDIQETDNTVTNDDCADLVFPAPILNCSNDVTGVGNNNACPDTEATCDVTSGVWYHFMVDNNVHTFNITGNDFEVFTGLCSSLSSLGCAGDPSLSNILGAGIRYSVLVYSDGVTDGMFTAEADPQTPPNNLCGSAIPLATGASVSNNGFTSCATSELAFCGLNTTSDHTVWYTYVVPTDTKPFNLEFIYAGTGVIPASNTNIGVFDACGGNLLWSTCASSPDIMECVLPGTTLTIGVGHADGNEGEFGFTINATNPLKPANDLCDQAIAVTPALDCTWQQVFGDNTNSCPEVYNGSCSQNTENTIWYSITLSANAVGVDIRNVTSAANIEIWNSDCSDPAVGPTGNQGCVTGDDFVPLAGGMTYLISVSSAGAFTFDIRTKVPPANDLCATAIILADGTPQTGTTGCATNDISFCAVTDPADHTVYYTFTVPSTTTSNNISFTYSGSGANAATDINIGVFDACGGNELFTSCNSSGDIMECVLPGTVLTIAVGSIDGQDGEFSLTIASDNTGIPANDLCDQAEVIAILGDCMYAPVSGDNTSSCPETFTGSCGQETANTVWYSIVLPANAVGVDIANLTGTPSIALFNNDCSAPGYSPSGEVGCTTAAGFVALPGGNTYLISVSSAGAFTFDIRTKVPPVNDLCADAISLTDGTPQLGTTACATNDISFCTVAAVADHTVYYTFTVPSTTTSNNLTFTYSGSGGNPASNINIGVYDACGGNELFTSCNSTGDIMECVLPGTVLTIAVGNIDGEDGDFTLTVASDNTGIPANDLCDQAEVIAIAGDCIFAPVSGDNTSSCPEAFTGSCAQDANNTVWYSIVLPANAVGVDIANLTGAPSIAFFNNDCSAPGYSPTGEIGCTSAADFVALTGGNTYLISVSSAGAFTFDIRTKVPPANDECANAEALALSTTVPGTTACATVNAEVAAGCAGTAENIVWYSYTVINDTKTLTLTISNFTTGTISVAATDGCGSTNYYNDDPNNEECGTAISLDIDCPTAGSTIYFSVSSSQAEEGDFDIAITESQVIVPANDDCTAPALSNGPLCEVYQSAIRSNQFACPEDFDLGGCGFDTEEVIWFQIDLPADANDIDLGINTYGGTGTPFFGVFSDCTGTSIDGNCYGNISAGDPVAGGVNIDVAAFAGTSIFVAVGSQGDDGGSIRLDIKINNTPDNDDPCTPEVVPGGGATLPGTTTCATGDYFEASCPTNYENTVWYEYTLGAGETGVEVEIAIGDATAPMGVMIVDQMGNCSSAPTIFPAAFSCMGSTTVVRAVCLMDGQVVHIAVGSSTANSGTFDITVTPIIPDPACVDNDLCADAEDFGELVTDDACISHSDCNLNACPDLMGSCNGGMPVNNVVWYQVQNDGTGDFISVEIDNAEFTRPVIAVFKGPDCNSLTQVGPCTTGNAGVGATGPLDIDPANPPIAGENYYIAIGSMGAVGGNFDLCIEILGGCVNDDPCDAVEIFENTTVTNPATTVNCTPDFTNPNCAGADVSSVWYKFTVPAGQNTVTVELNNISITGDISIQIGEYTAGNPACNTQLAPIVTECYVDRIIIPCLLEGEDYYIQVSSAAAMDEGAFDLKFTTIPPIIPNDLCSQVATDPAFHMEFTPDDYCNFVEITGTTIDACPDGVTPGCNFSLEETVWFQINVPNDPTIEYMDVQLEDLTQTSGNFSVFENDCDNLTTFDGSGCQSQATPITTGAVTPGASYLVAVSYRPNGNAGTFKIKVKLTAPPVNDLCENAIEIGLGDSVLGTTACATNSNDVVFDQCATASNESDVWYAIPVDPTVNVMVVDITGWTGGGNYAAQAYYTMSDCAGLFPVEVGGNPLVDCAGDKSFEIPVKCIDPSITHIYIKVGSPTDDGNAGNGMEQGDFTIAVSDLSGSCDFADECGDISSQVLNPVTDLDGAINYVCMPGCLQFACPETEVAICDFNNNPTVWFQVNTDLDAAQLYISVTNSDAGWDPVFAIFSGECGNLTPVSGGTATAPVICNTDDSTPDLTNVGVQNDASGNPIQTYYIAVSADGIVTDPTFNFCAATAISIVTCLGGIPPDNTNHTCDPAAIFEVTKRSNDPDGDLGLSLEGPFCPGELIDLRFNFFYDASNTGQDWLQGIVPTFGNAVDELNFDPSSASPSPGGANWFPNAIVNENVPNLCIDSNGKLCNSLCEVCDCSGPLTAGSTLPGGWFWVSNGGGGCSNNGQPSTMYGIPGGIQVNVQFDLQIKVKEFADAAECNNFSDDFTFSIQTFSDGVTGCWEDPLGECLKDVNQLISWPLECDQAPRVLINPNPAEICSDGFLDIDVTVEDGSNLEIDVKYEDNPNVTGMNDYNGFGNVNITDQLTNQTNDVQIVLYIMRAIDPNIICPGPSDTLEVTIYPEIKVEFEDYSICQGDCIFISPSSVVGGTGNYVDYEWSNGQQGIQIQVCPATSTSYILTVTDDLGCTGTEEVEVEVYPFLDITFLEEPYIFCQNEQEPFSDMLVQVNGFVLDPLLTWEITPFGVDGDVSIFSNEHDGDIFTINNFTSVTSGNFPYEVCVTLEYGPDCSFKKCTEMQIVESPYAELTLEEPLECNQALVKLVADLDESNLLYPFAAFELFDCNGDFVAFGANNPSVFEVDLSIAECYEIRTFNSLGCIGAKQFTFTPISGNEAVLDGTSPICKGENSTLSVTNFGDFDSYQWGPNAGNVTTPTVIVTPDTTTTYVVTVSDAGGCRDVKSIVINVTKTPVVNISGSLSYCAGSSTTLVASSSTGSTYLWTNSSGTTLSMTSNVTISTPDDYTIMITKDGCSKDSTIRVEEKTTLDVNLNNPSLCENNIDTLFAGNGFNLYEWTFNNSPIVGADTSFIEISQGGTYSVSITDINGCSGADTITVVNFNTPVAVVTDTIEVCRQNTGVGPFTIDFNAQVSGSTGTWDDIDLTGVDLSNLTSVSFEGIARDTYSFAFTTNTAMGNCENVTYVMEVIVMNCLCPVVTTRKIPDQCTDGSIIDLNQYLTSPSIQVGDWTFLTGPVTLTITNDTLDLTGVTAGMYTVRWSLANSIQNCPDSSEQTFIVHQAPTAGIVSGPKTLCNADTGQGNTSVDINTYLTPGTSPGVWTQKSGTDVSASIPNISGLGLTAGDVLVFTYTTNGATTPCKNVPVDLTITIRDCSCPIAIIDPLPPLCNDNNVINLNDYLTVDPPSTVGTWSVNITPSPITGGSMFNASGVLSGTYQITYTLTNPPGGCPATFTQDILIRRAPRVMAIKDANVCTANASGNDVTTVDLFTLLAANPSAGNWTQIGTPVLPIATGGIVDFNGQTIGDVFQFVYTTTSGQAPCVNISDTVAVTVVDCNCPNVDINPAGPLCNTEVDLDLSTLEGPNIDAGTWTVTGPSGAVAITGTVLPIAGLPAGNYNLKYTLDTPPAGACQGDSTQVLVIANQNTATVKTNGEACSEDVGNNENVIDLFSLVTAGNMNGKWYDPDGNEFTIPNFADFQQYNPGDIVTITYVVTSPPPCSSITYPVDIEILDCTCPPIKVTDFEICSSDNTVALAPFGDPNKPGSFVSTEVTITNGVADITSLNGNYDIDYVIDSPEPNCPDRRTFVMTVIKDFSAGTASTTSLCISDAESIDLFSLLEGEDVGGIWTETSNQPSSGTSFNAANGSFDTNGQAVGTYKFTYSFAGNTPCPDQSSEVTVTIQNIPPVDAGEAQTIDCTILEANLGGTAGNANFTYQWTHDGGIMVPNETDAQTTVDFGGVFTLTVTDNVTGCTSSDQVTIDVSNARPVAQVTSQNISCFGEDDAAINIINVTGGLPPYQYSSNGGVTYQNSPNFLNIDPGVYEMVLTDAAGCIITLRTITITEPAPLAIDLGKDTLVTFESRIPLSIEGQFDESRITSIVWTITTAQGDSIVCNTLNECLTYEYFANKNATICATISDDNGCVASDCININVVTIRDITLPQIFTPNNKDGVNDVFFVNDSDVERVEKFYIFDRWGNKVFSAENTPPNDPQYGWNGTFDGKDVVPGVYVYLIEILYKGSANEKETFSSDITVVR